MRGRGTHFTLGCCCCLELATVGHHPVTRCMGERRPAVVVYLPRALLSSRLPKHLSSKPTSAAALFRPSPVGSSQQPGNAARPPALSVLDSHKSYNPHPTRLRRVGSTHLLRRMPFPAPPTTALPKLAY